MCRRSFGSWTSALVLLSVLGIAACEGAKGPAGDPGLAGKSCTATTNADTSITIACEDGTSVTLTNGEDGVAGEDGRPCTATSDAVAGTVTVTCPGSDPVVIANGEDGAACTATSDAVAGTVTITCPGAAPVVVKNGTDAQPCTVVRDEEANSSTITCPGSAPVVVLDGTTGENGVAGQDGQPCTIVRDDVAKTSTITCPGSAPVVVKDGKDVDPATLAHLQAMAAVSPESCAVCHSESGVEHQAVYDKYLDATTLELILDSVVSVDSATVGKFDTTLTFTINQNGQPYVDVDGLPKSEAKRLRKTII